MAANHNQKDWARSGIRIPKDLHQQVHEAAKNEGRTFNSQLLTFIREGVQSRAKPATLGVIQHNEGVAA
jgi:hypothetical protein